MVSLATQAMLVCLFVCCAAIGCYENGHTGMRDFFGIIKSGLRSHSKQDNSSKVLMHCMFDKRILVVFCWCSTWCLSS